MNKEFLEKKAMSMQKGNLCEFASPISKVVGVCDLENTSYTRNLSECVKPHECYIITHNNIKIVYNKK